ncbi:MAG: CRTAC1 family protein, partial [Chloroflexi bacterium]|nr:CRTAC1 family protein [Chloroflexota bacterium]
PDHERDDYLQRIAQLAQRRGFQAPKQIVFDGNALADLREDPILEELLSQPAWPAACTTPQAFLGAAVAIKEPTAAGFVRNNGSNLLVVGHRDESALGVLAASLISLALQHPADGNCDGVAGARFYVLDGTRPDAPEVGYLNRLAAAVPHETKISGPRGAAALIGEIAAELERRQTTGSAGVRAGTWRLLSLLPLLLSLVAGCSRGGATTATSGKAAESAPAVRLTDVAEEVGIRFRHTSGTSGRLYLPETMGSGCAFLDYDGDGRLDLFLVNSSRLPGFTKLGPFYPALYRQMPDGTFKDVTREAGLAVDCYGMGVAVGDYDNDGDSDLYLTAFERCFLYRNMGDGTFTEVGRAAEVADPSFSTSCAWVDVDRDGHLDLFVGNYCVWTPETNQVCPDALGRRHLCPPAHYVGVSSRLYRNIGDGTFRDVTRESGLYNTAGKALGVLIFDENDDGWLDLLIANDLEPNLLYRNMGNGTFTEVGVEVGVAYSSAGRARAGMGIDSADLDHQGRESVVIGNGTSECLALFRRPPDAPEGGEIAFTDDAEIAGLAGPSLPFLTFGVLFADYDLDGRKDLFVANGHIDPNVAVIGGDNSFPQRMLLFQNRSMPESGVRFVEVGRSAGEALAVARVHRGLAMGDFDSDGDPDFLVTVCDGKPLLLRNEALPSDADASRRWLIIQPVGTRSNRFGLGTRFRLRAGGVWQLGWVRSGSSYLSESDHRAYFGLGAASRVEELEIRWPSGVVQTLRDVPANQVLVVTEPRE